MPSYPETRCRAHAQIQNAGWSLSPSESDPDDRSLWQGQSAGQWWSSGSARRIIPTNHKTVNAWESNLSRLTVFFFVLLPSFCTKAKDKILYQKIRKNRVFGAILPFLSEFCYRSATNLLQTTEKGGLLHVSLSIYKSESVSLLYIKKHVDTRKSRLPFQVNGLTFGGELGTRTPDPLRVMQVL